MRELEHLLQDLSSAGVWLELAVLSACMAVAYLISARLGRGQSQDTVWFGRRIWDGVLFSTLCVALIFPARLALAEMQTVALLRVALPIFISLALIRLVVRVLSSAFPTSGTVQFWSVWSVGLCGAWPCCGLPASCPLSWPSWMRST